MRYLILALAAATSAGCSDSTDNAAPANEANRAYIDGIVPHHQAGIASTDEAIAKARHERGGSLPAGRVVRNN